VTTTKRTRLVLSAFILVVGIVVSRVDSSHDSNWPMLFGVFLLTAFAVVVSAFPGKRKV
jgi:hypothetical protein